VREVSWNAVQVTPSNRKLRPLSRGCWLLPRVKAAGCAAGCAAVLRLLLPFLHAAMHLLKSFKLPKTINACHNRFQHRPRYVRWPLLCGSIHSKYAC
jgi:hypothetical protein